MLGTLEELNGLLESVKNTVDPEESELNEEVHILAIRILFKSIVKCCKKGFVVKVVHPTSNIVLDSSTSDFAFNKHLFICRTHSSNLVVFNWLKIECFLAGV